MPWGLIAISTFSMWENNMINIFSELTIIWQRSHVKMNIQNEQFEDTKEVIKKGKLKKDRQL